MFGVFEVLLTHTPIFFGRKRIQYGTRHPLAASWLKSFSLSILEALIKLGGNAKEERKENILFVAGGFAHKRNVETERIDN